MMRVQRSATSLERLWKLVDTDGDGKASYYEIKNAFAHWSLTLAHDAEECMLDNEKSFESRIDYKRFVEIFLPVALSVPPEQVYAHLSHRFADQSSQEAKDQSAQEAKAQSAQQSRKSVARIARKSTV